MEAPKESHWEKTRAVGSLDGCEKKPIPPIPWSVEDETQLKKLREDNIKVIDTALGRERLKLQKQSIAHLLNMTEEERVVSNLPAEVLESIKNAVGV